MKDPTLSDTEKVLRVAEYKQQYNVQDRELFAPKRLGAVPAQPLPQAAAAKTVKMPKMTPMTRMLPLM